MPMASSGSFLTMSKSMIHTHWLRVCCITGLLLTAGVIACDRDEEIPREVLTDAEQADQGTAQTTSREAAAPDPEVLAQAKELVAGRQPLQPEHYEVLMLDLRECDVSDTLGTIDAGCPQHSLVGKARTIPNRDIQNISSMWRDPRPAPHRPPRSRRARLRHAVVRLAALSRQDPRHR